MEELKISHTPVVEEASTTQPTSSNNDESPKLPTWRLALLLTGLCIGFFLSILDTSIVATALYSIGIEFSSPRSVTWVALTYTLAYLGFAVPFANLSDVTGRRTAWLLAFTIFFAFSLACGFVQILRQLVAFRAMQGVGGSGLYSLTMVLLREIVPARRRGLIGTLAGLVVAVAGVTGPIVGGVITKFTTWRWVFWINGPIGLVAVILFLLTWPEKDMMQRVERRSWKRIDFVGILLLLAASVLVVFAFQEAGLKTHSWSKAIFLAPLIAGCVCWILLFAWEFLISRHSISAVLPPHLFKRRLYSFSVFMAMATGFVSFVSIYSLPTFFQVVNKTSPLGAGVALVPFLISSAVGSAIGGMAMKQTFATLAAASCLMAIGTGLLSTLSLHTGVEAKAYGFEILLGLGTGMSISNTTMVAGTDSEPTDNAIAQGVIAQTRVFGGSVGIAASTAILGIMVERASKTSSADPEMAERKVYVAAFSKTMWVSAILACLCFVFSFGTYSKNAPKESPIEVLQQQSESSMNKEIKSDETIV